MFLPSSISGRQKQFPCKPKLGQSLPPGSGVPFSPLGLFLHLSHGAFLSISHIWKGVGHMWGQTLPRGENSVCFHFPKPLRPRCKSTTKGFLQRFPLTGRTALHKHTNKFPAWRELLEEFECMCFCEFISQAFLRYHKSNIFLLKRLKW